MVYSIYEYNGDHATIMLLLCFYTRSFFLISSFFLEHRSFKSIFSFNLTLPAIFKTVYLI